MGRAYRCGAEVAHALGQINGKINPKDLKIQWNLVKVIQLREEIEISRWKAD